MPPKQVPRNRAYKPTQGSRYLGTAALSTPPTRALRLSLSDIRASPPRKENIELPHSSPDLFRQLNRRIAISLSVQSWCCCYWIPHSGIRSSRLEHRPLCLSSSNYDGHHLQHPPAISNGSELRSDFCICTDACLMPAHLLLDGTSTQQLCE